MGLERFRAEKDGLEFQHFTACFIDLIMYNVDKHAYTITYICLSSHPLNSQ